MANGYMGKILRVDLDKGTTHDEILDEQTCKDFVGGYGIGARMLFSKMKPGINPLGPDNILGFMTGPCTGSPAISPSRYMVFCKSPWNGGWGDANSGGDFGPGLKFGGFDGVYFTGMSSKPVYLYIENGKAELRDARELWGKDADETQDIIKNIHGKSVYSCCIGQAGENISLISAIMNNYGRCAARSGVGAVMGSKRLKAIAVNGNQKVPIANPARAEEVRKAVLEKVTKHPFCAFFRGGGTANAVAGVYSIGDSPVKNWGGVPGVEFPSVNKISDTAIMSKFQKKYGCWRCPLACGGFMQAGTEYPYKAGAHKPEYETLALFGTSCLNDNAESIIMANDICNKYGVDTISAAGAVAFTIECYENGLLTKNDTDGLEMTWGNHKSIVAMTEKIAKREGFGAVLADGVKVASEKIGKGSEKYAIHVGGSAIPAHDPKVQTHLATTYRIDATPGRHMQGEGNCPPGIAEPYDVKKFTGRGVSHLRHAAMTHVMACSGTCDFVYESMPHISDFIDTLNSITGWDLDIDGWITKGDRITTIRHVFNLREGINPLKIPVPDRLLGKPSFSSGPSAGVEIDEATMAREYLVAEDWDVNTTLPSKAKLMSLGLDDVVSQLYKE